MVYRQVGCVEKLGRTGRKSLWLGNSSCRVGLLRWERTGGGDLSVILCLSCQSQTHVLLRQGSPSTFSSHYMGASY